MRRPWPARDRERRSPSTATAGTAQTIPATLSAQTSPSSAAAAGTHARARPTPRRCSSAVSVHGTSAASVAAIAAVQTSLIPPQRTYPSSSAEHDAEHRRERADPALRRRVAARAPRPPRRAGPPSTARNGVHSQIRSMPVSRPVADERKDRAHRVAAREVELDRRLVGRRRQSRGAVAVREHPVAEREERRRVVEPQVSGDRRRPAQDDRRGEQQRTRRRRRALRSPSRVALSADPVRARAPAARRRRAPRRPSPSARGRGPSRS